MKRALVLLALLAPPARADAPDLLASGGKESVRLRLEVTVDGEPPEAAWEAFLDRLFDFLDRDGDGVLSPQEAARAIPLPLPGRREVVLDFAKLDADRDGKGRRAAC
jgi:hypothetical protein